MTNKVQDLMQQPSALSTKLVPSTSQHITVDKLKALLPARTGVAVTQEIVDLIHRMEDDIGLPQEQLEEEVLTHTHLLSGMRGAGMKELVNAIKFCNLKRNYDNKEAWSIVFPDKYQRLVELNKQIDNHVSMYNTSKLVVAIDKEMLIPIHLQYAPYFHAAVKKQFNLMQGNATKGKDGKPMVVTPMVQHLAAKELATLTRQPEEQKLSIDINPGAAAMDMQEQMNQQLSVITDIMKKRIDNGDDIIDVQQLGINFDSLAVTNE